MPHRIEPRSWRAPGALLALALLAACASNPYAGRTAGFEIVQETAGLALDRGELALASGDPGSAFQHAYEVWILEDPLPEDRARADALLERAVDRLLATDEVATTGSPGPTGGRGEIAAEVAAGDLDGLDDLWNLELPRRLRVRLGLTLARARLALGEPLDAFRTIKAIDELYPVYEERAAAAAVVAEAGLMQAADQGSHLFFLRQRDRAVGPLEYLVLRHPSSSACPRAYAALTAIYEEQGEYELAEERARDLALYHARDPLALRAELDAPRLRLARIDRPEYDRGAFLSALEEIDGWLLRHGADPDPAAAELVPIAEALREDCLERLIDSDLALVRFYERIEEPIGARLHAERAVETARALGDAERLGRAQAHAARWHARGDAANAAGMAAPRVPDHPDAPDAPDDHGAEALP